MAIWQYTFHILTRNSVEALAPTLEFDREEGYFDDERFWKFQLVNKDYFNGIEKILCKCKSWSSNIELFGNQESNCIELLLEGDFVISASFRIDFTSDYLEILRGIIEFCILKNLIILNESLDVVSLDEEAVNRIILNSQRVKDFNKFSSE